MVTAARRRHAEQVAVQRKAVEDASAAIDKRAREGSQRVEAVAALVALGAVTEVSDVLRLLGDTFIEVPT